LNKDKYQRDLECPGGKYPNGTTELHPVLRLLKLFIPGKTRLALQLLALRVRNYFQVGHELGLRASIDLYRANRILRGKSRRNTRKNAQIICSKPKRYRNPLYYRHGTSDILVIRNILYNEEYACVGREKEPHLIIDCGANIGCASLYFLHKYPQAHLIAIEPDEENYSLCLKNLEPFADRVTLVKAAIWPLDTGLRIVRGTYRDGLEWSHQVRVCSEGESPDIEAVSFSTLLKNHHDKPIDILKIDIERAERNLFLLHYEQWLCRVKVLVVELHDEECERIFLRAVANYQHTIQKLNGLTVCRILSSH